jgi:hypothetical protein
VSLRYVALKHAGLGAENWAEVTPALPTCTKYTCTKLAGGDMMLQLAPTLSAKIPM